jgi:hypothetical protein
LAQWSKRRTSAHDGRVSDVLGIAPEAADQRSQPRWEVCLGCFASSPRSHRWSIDQYDASGDESEMDLLS